MTLFSQVPGADRVGWPKLAIMTSAELTPDQLRRDPLPLRGRVAVVTGVSRRAGIGYAIARRLAALGASLFLHQFAPHDRDQPWGADPGGPEAVLDGRHRRPRRRPVQRAAPGTGPGRPGRARLSSSARPARPSGIWTSWLPTTPAAAATVPWAR